MFSEKHTCNMSEWKVVITQRTPKGQRMQAQEEWKPYAYTPTSTGLHSVQMGKSYTQTNPRHFGRTLCHRSLIVRMTSDPNVWIMALHLFHAKCASRSWPTLLQVSRDPLFLVHEMAQQVQQEKVHSRASTPQCLFVSVEYMPRLLHRLCVHARAEHQAQGPAGVRRQCLFQFVNSNMAIWSYVGQFPVRRALDRTAADA